MNKQYEQKLAEDMENSSKEFLDYDGLEILVSEIKKEIKRIQDFACISENPSYSDVFIKKLCEKYDVNIFGKDDEDGWY